MGACILCGKSAGLFYSLHKNCFEKYNGTDQTIAEYLLEDLGRVESVKLAQKINYLLTNLEFASEARQRTLNRGLEYFSKHHVEKNKNLPFEIAAWIALLYELSPDESLFVNKYFIAQQQNLIAMQALQANQLPDCNYNPANFTIVFRDNEALWWCFDNSYVEQLKPVKHNRQWSVVTQVIDGLFRKKQKQSLERKNLGEGKVLITNQRVYFESDENCVSTEYANIYSCTPVENGVCLQSTQLTSIPQAYYCEDGRLLYGFVKYAQNLLENKPRNK